MSKGTQLSFREAFKLGVASLVWVVLASIVGAVVPALNGLAMIFGFMGLIGVVSSLWYMAKAAAMRRRA